MCVTSTSSGTHWLIYNIYTYIVVCILQLDLSPSSRLCSFIDLVQYIIIYLLDSNTIPNPFTPPIDLVINFFPPPGAKAINVGYKSLPRVLEEG